jgi:hypothetical protein
VVPQMRLARGRLDRDRRPAEAIVHAAHVAPGRGLLVLMDCHFRYSF